jgi:hypothetical protein
MGLMFGKQDDIDCLLPTTFDGPHGDQLCLASHVSQYFFAAGVYVKDEGYVLKVKGSNSYYAVDDAQLKALQEQQILPATLPPHHISTGQYLFGYSLWLILAAMGLFAVLKKMFGKMQPFFAAQTPPVTGPPVGRKDWDRWLTSELTTKLAPGEKLQHQAYAINHPPDAVSKNHKVLFLVLTDQRFLIFDAKMGFTGIKRELGELSAIPRAELLGIARDELHLQLQFADGHAQHYWVVGSQRQFSNQWLFARDVPRLVAAQQARLDSR